MSSTEVDIGGFLKLDAMFSQFSDGDVAALDAGRDYFRPNSVPVAATPAAEDAHGFTDFHAKDTRFFLKMKSNVDGATLGGYLELDFRSGSVGNEISSNGYVPRLRRSFVTWDNLLIGQEWSLFRNTDASPDTIDDIRGPNEALVVVRQPQIRYTFGAFEVAIENAETNLLPNVGGGTSTTFVTGDSVVPDLTARYTLKLDGGGITVALLLRQLTADQAATGGTAPNDVADGQTLGAGLNVSGKVPLFGSDDVRFSLAGGQGVGRYVGLTTVADAVVDDDGGLEAIPVYAGYVAYRHPWSPRWRSSIVLGHFTADHDADFASSSVTHTVSSAHLNLLFTPIDKLTLGFELMHGIRELENGEDGSLSRLQFSTKYDF